MGCNNEADTETLLSARTSDDAISVTPPGQGTIGAVAATLAAVAQIHGDQPSRSDIYERDDRAIRDARAGKPVAAADRSAYGSVAEAAVAQFVVEKLGHVLVHMNEKASEKGIDIVTLDPKTDAIFVWESKSSVTAGSITSAPVMGRSLDGRQLSEQWIENRLSAIGLENAKASDVVAMAVKVDLTGIEP